MQNPHSLHFVKRSLFTVIASVASVSAMAQQTPAQVAPTLQPRYAAPSPYGVAPPSNPAVAAAVANGRERPAPAASMPTPLPPSRVQQALEQVAPLAPDEVIVLRKEILQRQRAASENVTQRKPARPTTSAETLDLTPGATPPIIRVAVGQGAVLSFVDAAGRPWEIQDDQNFNDRAFAVRLLGPHLYSVTLKSAETAHIAVVLKGLSRPISVTAVPAVEEADYIKEFAVPRFIDGQPPAAIASSSAEGALAFNAPELLDFLYRTPPKSAKQLQSTGLPGVTVWQTSSTRMVVRTAGQVVIPAFSRRHGSSDGVAVYEVPLSPVVSITQGGALHRVQISGMAVESASR